MSKKALWYTITGIVLLLGFPIFMDLVLIPGNTAFGTKETWINFFACYFGSTFGGIIGGLFTFLGVKQTLTEGRKQKFIDEFPDKMSNLESIIRWCNSDQQHNNYINGIAQYFEPQVFIGYIEEKAREVLVNSAKTDGKLFSTTKPIIDKMIDLSYKQRQNQNLKTTQWSEEFRRTVLGDQSKEERKQYVEQLKPLISILGEQTKEHLKYLERKFQIYTQIPK